MWGDFPIIIYHTFHHDYHLISQLFHHSYTTTKFIDFTMYKLVRCIHTIQEYYFISYEMYAGSYSYCFKHTLYAHASNG